MVRKNGPVPSFGPRNQVPADTGTHIYSCCTRSKDGSKAAQDCHMSQRQAADVQSCTQSHIHRETHTLSLTASYAR